MCELLEISRSGFYAWSRRRESERARRDRELLGRIEEIHVQSRTCYGSPRIHHALRKEGTRCGRKRVARLMKRAEIRGKVRRKFQTTTNSKHAGTIAPNLLEKLGSVTRINQIWVADITYIRTREGWLYLASIMDLYSRKIIGWSFRDTLHTELPADALKMALERRRPRPGLIHHSDRGSQYASEEYQKLLQAHGVISSMSGKGNCYDNAAKESFFHTLKAELVRDEDYRTRADARSSIFDYIETFYNRDRLHSSLGYETPDAYEAIAGGAA